MRVPAPPVGFELLTEAGLKTPIFLAAAIRLTPRIISATAIDLAPARGLIILAPVAGALPAGTIFTLQLSVSVTTLHGGKAAKAMGARSGGSATGISRGGWKP